MKIKLAIADDHPMVIQGITALISSYRHLEVIATYNTGNALLDGLTRQLPDVLLLDIQLPDMTGNELARIISSTYPKLRILVVSSVDNPFHVNDMLRHGCLGYILKNTQADTLATAIEKVYNGEEFIEPSLKEQLLQSILHPKQTKVQNIKLTKRELEILKLVCAGDNNYEIAEKLFLSHRTIENHRLSMYQKFNVKNVAALVKIALQQGLID